MSKHVSKMHRKCKHPECSWIGTEVAHKDHVLLAHQGLEKHEEQTITKDEVLDAREKILHFNTASMLGDEWIDTPVASVEDIIREMESTEKDKRFVKIHHPSDTDTASVSDG